ncbi:hypothetical protein F2Q68_00045794 [Brassica cretica]|uniref:Peroxidase n=1 Tax=Brassica cretica TaxID=69181 RepID=A0A8S9LF95_BRACR|nr:hypothetical protein F2Q68_00045794 [Brassica cretica]
MKLLVIFIVHAICIPCFSFDVPGKDLPLTLDYYKSTCPTVFDVVKKEMECIVKEDPRNAAILIRLHFHDCFVQGCDGSVLLEETETFQGEKKASPNINSLKGYKIVDRIKNIIESECPGVVSCADLLTISARDATILYILLVSHVGGPYWDVPVGRKDSKTAGYEFATSNIPTPEEGLISIISKFHNQGLSVEDMVALSDVPSEPQRDMSCEQRRRWQQRDGDGQCDADLFDNSIYHTLMRGEGLLNSDQEMYTSMFGIQTRRIVSKYAEDQVAFFEQFSKSMVKMGNILNSESFVDGEVRRSCRFVNT